MNVVLAQILTGDDPEANLELMQENIKIAAQHGAHVIVFPEASMRAFGGSPLKDIAQPITGPWAQTMLHHAQTYNIAIVAGMFTPAEEKKVFNTTIVAQPDGRIQYYHKIHTYDVGNFRESDSVAKGFNSLLVNIAGFPIGITCCYDIRFPELFVQLAQAGAHAIIVVASWAAGLDKIEQWNILTRARALDSTSFILACDQADPESVGKKRGTAPSGIGYSTVVGPAGNIISQAGTAPELLHVYIDYDEVRTVRNLLPTLRSRLSDETKVRDDA